MLNEKPQKYVLSATMMMNNQGQMRRSAAECYWLLCMDHEITEYEVRHMIFFPKNAFDKTDYVPKETADPPEKSTLFPDSSDEDEETDEDEESAESEDAETDGEEEEEESLASLASVRSDATSGIELEDDQEGNARISKLDKTNELFDHGDFEASLEEYRKEIAGKEEDVCHEMGGSGNVVRAMMKAVECYESTMMDLT